MLKFPNQASSSQKQHLDTQHMSKALVDQTTAVLSLILDPEFDVKSNNNKWIFVGPKICIHSFLTCSELTLNPLIRLSN